MSMITRLLIVKSGTRYIRFLDKSFSLTEMNKASVFPIEQISILKEKIVSFNKKGLVDAEIRLLTITENEFKEDE